MTHLLRPFPEPSERMLAALVDLAILARGGDAAEAIMATGEILPRHARVLRPGTIDVAILEPVTDLRVDDLDAQVAALRDRFDATLANWPGAR